ncbi:MAG: S8 family serine peptidase [Candidatus Eiseniibacteriota bacterium]
MLRLASRLFVLASIGFGFAGSALPASAAVPARPQGSPKLLSGTPSATAARVPAREVLAIVDQSAVRTVAGLAPQGTGARGRTIELLEMRDPGIASALAQVGVDRITALGPASRTRQATGQAFVRLTSARPDFDAGRAAAVLRATAGVRAATPNTSLRLFSTVPNDSFAIYQWHLDLGFPPAISMTEAWDITHGSPSTVIAIMDNSVDTSHPDLVSKIWTNPGETPANSIDDDGNGFVDDVNGWDFGDEDNDPKPHPILDEIGIDVAFHGTFCAGLAGAATNNLIGIAGTGWDCTIMPLKIASTAGTMLVSDASEAFFYAADNGADVLSMSFGAPPDSGLGDFFQALVDMAVGADVACVAAAGNDGLSSPVVPASNTGVLSVGASDETNARAFFSNYGPWVKVAAPGTIIFSSIQQNYEFDVVTAIIYAFFFGWDEVNPYMLADGTSMACPITAGVVGLVRSHYPWMTASQAIQRVIDTGDDVVYDQPIGRKVNAFRAVSDPIVGVGDLPDGAAGSTGVAFLPSQPMPFRTSTTIRFVLPHAATARVSVYDSRGGLVRELAGEELPAGAHSIAWDGRDASGGPVGAGVYFLFLSTPGATARERIVRLP